MRHPTVAALALSLFALPATAQVIVLPVLTPGGALASVTTPVFSALPAPLATSTPLPADLTVLENGSNGSGINQVLGLGIGNDTSPIIGSQLNNTLGTPLLGLPRGSAQPVDLAILGGDGVGNSSAAGVAGVAALSGSNVANGGLAGVGVLNRDGTGNGQLVGVAALSGRNSGNASQGLGVGALNRGEAAGVSVAGSRVVTLGGLGSQARGALPGLDAGGVALAGGKPVTSSNPLANAGVLAGDNAGNGGLVGVAALSGSNAANAQLVGVGALNQGGSGKGALGVDVLSGNGSGVSSNGAGVALLSGDGSGSGAAAGAGVLTGSNSGTGGVLGAGVLSGGNSGKSQTAGVGALSGGNSGTGGTLGGNVAGSSGGADGGSGSGTGGNGNGNGSNGASSSTGGAFAYNGSGESSGATRAAAATACKADAKDAKGRRLRTNQCVPVKADRKV